MYDNTNASPTNRVTLTGRISSEPRYSHEIYGEAFYEFSLEVKRLSDMADTLGFGRRQRIAFLLSQHKRQRALEIIRKL